MSFKKTDTVTLAIKTVFFSDKQPNIGFAIFSPVPRSSSRLPDVPLTLCLVIRLSFVLFLEHDIDNEFE